MAGFLLPTCAQIEHSALRLSRNRGAGLKLASSFLLLSTRSVHYVTGPSCCASLWSIYYPSVSKLTSSNFPSRPSRTHLPTSQDTPFSTYRRRKLNCPRVKSYSTGVAQTMGSYASETTQAGVGRPYKVLVAGCSYSGLAASVNLLEQCDKIDHPISVEVTIVDERDGFCESKPFFMHPPTLSSHAMRPLLTTACLYRSPHRITLGVVC